MGEDLHINKQTNICIANHTRLLSDFALDPIIPPFDFHFRIYKRDLAILTE
jgi:hypothetical protein